MDPPPPPVSEVEQELKRIQAHQGVEGTVLLNNKGVVLKTTMKEDLQALLLDHITGIAFLGNNVIRELEPANELKYLRIVTQMREIIIAPNEEFTLITVQKSLE